jgi:hypothetical protein
MNSKIFWELNEAYQLGVCNQEVVEEETLSDDDIEGIQEWVEALVAEGYDLDQYTDDELCEAYLEEAKIDVGKSKEEKISIRRSRQGASRDWDYDDSNRQALHRLERGEKPQRPRVRYGATMPGAYSREQEYLKTLSPEQREKRMAQNKKGVGRKLSKVNLPEQLDIYDIVSDYLVSEGFCDTSEDASVIMANMSDEWRDSIMEEVFDEAKKYESHVLKGVPEKVHGTVKKAVRSQTKQKSEPTTRQKVLRHKLSSLRDRNDESDEPVRGSKRGAESPTDR